MEPISRLGRMMGLVRSGQSGRSGKAREGRAASASAGTGASRGKPVGEAPAGVREQIMARLQGLDLDSPPGQQRGVRIFLEAVFRDELGEGLMSSPRFNDIVHEVQAVLGEDAQVRAELIELLREMQNPTR